MIDRASQQPDLRVAVNGDGHSDTAPRVGSSALTIQDRRELLVQPLLVSAKEAAALCGVSLPTWHRRVAAGETPAPVRFGGRILFNRAELAEWCASRTHDGRLPNRSEWESMKAVRKK